MSSSTPKQRVEGAPSRGLTSVGPLVVTPRPSVDGGGDQVRRLTELLEAVLERNDQLQRALETRIVIEQAKGVLAERLDVDPDTAFALLRRAARSSRRRLHDVAAEVVGSRLTPPELQRVVVEAVSSPGAVR